MTTAVYLYDGSIEGLLCAVAAAVKGKSKVTGIYPAADFTPSLFDNPVHIETDTSQAGRLYDYLSKLHPRAVRFAINGYLSESRELGLHLCNFVRLCLAKGRSAVSLHSNESVRFLDDLCRKVSFEAHRLNGLIRFRILEDGVQYGPFESDYNVIGFCAHHFRLRLATRDWILHDLKRNFALYWDQKELRPVDVDADIVHHVKAHGELPLAKLTNEEQHFQTLWRSFHSEIANTDRENKLLQRQLMPRRYWKYLTEFKD